MLFDPIKVGGLELKNRICMPALHHGYTPDGFVNEKLIRYYETRATGGAALITVGGCSIDTLGGGPMMIGLYDDKFVPGMAELAGAVKGAGAKIAAQLYHAGRYTHSAFSGGQQSIAPSAVASRFTRETPREMARADIEMVKDSFAAAARRARQAGFDAVEVIASAGYLICQFLSPLTNQRTDEYGGSWENRCRFGVEVIGRIREAVGPAFTVLARIAGNDFIPGSSTNAEAAMFAAALEKAGVDCLNVTGGWHETRVPQITGDLPRGGFAYLARGVRDAVGIPVIASNRINDPRTAERILEDGLADLVNMGRVLLADPEFPNKLQAGRERSIRRCIACNQGCMDMVFALQGVHCAVNPLAGREHEVAVEPAPVSRKVLVIGGGPAGLEAARTAAARGHRVTLWEKGPRLGGQLLYAALPPGKHEISTLVEYFEHELAALGVAVVLDKEAGAAEIAGFGADAVILAAGSRPAEAPFPVRDGVKLATARQILTGEVVPGKRVVIVGGGSVGCETALAIAERGTLDASTLKFLMENEAETPETLQKLLNRGTRQVAIVEMLKGIGGDFGITTRWVVLKQIRRLGVKVMDQTRVMEVSGQGVRVAKDGAESLLPADTVVLATGAVPANELAGALDGLVNELHVIGDAVKPRKITEAIREGFDLALRL